MSLSFGYNWLRSIPGGRGVWGSGCSYLSSSTLSSAGQLPAAQSAPHGAGASGRSSLTDRVVIWLRHVLTVGCRSKMNSLMMRFWWFTTTSPLGTPHNPTVVCLGCAFSPSLYPSPSLHCSAHDSLSFLDLRGNPNCSSLIPLGRGPIYDIPSWIPCAGPTHTFALSSVDIQPVPRAALTFWLSISDTTVNLGFFPRTSTSVLYSQGGF